MKNELAADGQETRAWVGVVSLAHVERGVQGGFAQVCHGKQQPLSRMRVGDWFVYYSPSTEMGGGERLRAFTAIGRVCNRAGYTFDVGGGFVPFRRDIDYCEARAVALDTLRDQLQFTRSSWGMRARRGHFEISLADAARIAHAMGVRELEKRQLTG